MIIQTLSIYDDGGVRWGGVCFLVKIHNSNSLSSLTWIQATGLKLVWFLLDQNFATIKPIVFFTCSLLALKADFLFWIFNICLLLVRLHQSIKRIQLIERTRVMEIQIVNKSELGIILDSKISFLCTCYTHNILNIS